MQKNIASHLAALCEHCGKPFSGSTDPLSEYQDELRTCKCPECGEGLTNKSLGFEKTADGRSWKKAKWLVCEDGKLAWAEKAPTESFQVGDVSINVVLPPAPALADLIALGLEN